jgi:NH3-dependent NAD+ synthetase
MTLTHLRQLEAESIHIIREVVAEFERPVLLFSGGKDSACMLHVARKAFYPAPRRSRCCTSTPPGTSASCSTYRDASARARPRPASSTPTSRRSPRA